MLEFNHAENFHRNIEFINAYFIAIVFVREKNPVDTRENKEIQVIFSSLVLLEYLIQYCINSEPMETIEIFI